MCKMLAHIVALCFRFEDWEHITLSGTEYLDNVIFVNLKSTGDSILTKKNSMTGDSILTRKKSMRVRIDGTKLIAFFRK